jgi:hypothetical protein
MPHRACIQPFMRASGSVSERQRRAQALGGSYVMRFRGVTPFRCSTCGCVAERNVPVAERIGTVQLGPGSGAGAGPGWGRGAGVRTWKWAGAWGRTAIVGSPSRWTRSGGSAREAGCPSWQPGPGDRAHESRMISRARRSGCRMDRQARATVSAAPPCGGTSRPPSPPRPRLSPPSKLVSHRPPWQ